MLQVISYHSIIAVERYVHYLRGDALKCADRLAAVSWRVHMGRFKIGKTELQTF